MNYIKIFKIVFSLISSPAKAWEDISLQWDSQKVIIDFVYPMIGFCGLSFLIGSLIRRGWNTPMSFQLAMVDCCGVAVALFAGFFLVSYLINHIGIRWFGLFPDMARAELFTGYALSLTFLGEIVLGLFPQSLIYVGLIQLYVFYIVYTGAPVVMRVESHMRLGFTIVASVLLLVCPWLIQFIFQKLTVLFS